MDGVFTADPRIVPRRARRIPRITYEEMLEMAACGAKVLHAALRGVRPAVRHPDPRPVVVQQPDRHLGQRARERRAEETGMEQAIISGVAHDRSEAKITVVGVPDKVGEAARIFRVIADAGDQHRHDRAERLRRGDRAHRHLVHAAPRRTGRRAHGRAARGCRTTIGFESLLYDDRIGKVSLIGAGMRSHPGVTRDVLRRARRGRGEHRDDLHLGDPDLGRGATRTTWTRPCTAAHKAFDLDADEVEAVVYGGTGR